MSRFGVGSLVLCNSHDHFFWFNLFPRNPAWAAVDLLGLEVLHLGLKGVRMLFVCVQMDSLCETF